MGFNEIVFLTIIVFSIICLVFWKIKIDPDRGGFWIYGAYVLLVGLVSVFALNPWRMFG